MLRRSLLALAAFALVLALAACGGVTDPLNPLAAAAQRSSSAGGVKMHMDASFTAAGQSASFSADGLFDGDQGEVTLDMGSLLGAAGGSGDATVIVTKQDGKPVLYVKLPQLATFLPGGKEWMKVDVEQAIKDLNVGGSAQDMFGAAGQSPADVLKLLEKVGTVTEVGDETVDGAATTHYHATVDIEQALENAGAPSQALAAVKQSGIETQVPVDVWIGKDDGYVHRVKVVYNTTANGQSIDGEFTMTLSDWGSDVSIGVPSDDQVLDATSLLAKLHHG